MSRKLRQANDAGARRPAKTLLGLSVALVVIGGTWGCGGSTSSDAESENEASSASGESETTPRDREPRIVNNVREGGRRKKRDEAGGPRISVKGRKHHDFGEVIEGQEVEHDFVLVNKGDAPLTLERVATTCGCSGVKVERYELAPRESSRLTLSYRSDGAVGEKQKVVRVVSDDPVRRDLQLSFDATVIRLLDIQPDALEIGDIAEGTPWQGEITVSSLDGSPFRVTGVECRVPELTFTVPDKEKNTDPTSIRVDLSGDAERGWPGPQKLFVNIRFDHDQHERLRIPVTARVIAPIAVEPKTLQIGEFERATGAKIQCEVHALREGDSFPKPSVEVDARANRVRGSGKVRASVAEVEEGRRWSITVEVEPGYTLESLSGNVKVTIPTTPATVFRLPLLGTPTDAP